LSEAFQFCSDYLDSICESDSKKTDRSANAARESKNGGPTTFHYGADQASQHQYDWDLVDDEYGLLCEQVSLNSGFPTTPLFNLANRKAALELQMGKVEQAALTLMQVQATALRHQAISQYSKRHINSLQQQQKTVDASGATSGDGSEEGDDVYKQILNFDVSDADLLGMIEKDLPAEWRIVQISVDDLNARFKAQPKDEPITDENLGLLMVTAQCGGGGGAKPPPNNKKQQQFSKKVDGHNCSSLNVLRVSAVPVQDKMPTIMKELHDVVSLHNRIYKSDKIAQEQSKFSQLKEEVEDRLVSLMDTVENKWLGFAKVMMLGKPCDAQRRQAVDEVVLEVERKHLVDDADFVGSGRRQVLNRIVDGANHLTRKQLFQGVMHVLAGDHDKLDAVMETLLEQLRAKKLQGDPEDGTAANDQGVKRHPVVLVLDKHVQSFPFESLSFLQKTAQPQPMSRVPSVAFLCALASKHLRSPTSVAKTGVRQDKVFYVLNPGKDCERTQKRLEGQLRSMSLGEGIVGQEPSMPDMKRFLTEMDAYMYMGHGSSEKYLPGQEVKKLEVRALPLLFGCNSGRLSRLGRSLDPTGTASCYLIASAPSILGFLWSITDRDTDKWTVTFLQHWLGKKGEAAGAGGGAGLLPHEPDFVRAVANHKKHFQKIINGAATVVYGLPSVSM